MQENNEEAVCTFIHNIMTNSYDEFGEIFLGGGGLGSYIHAVSTLNESQRHILAFSIFLVLSLAAYTACLHRTVTRNKFVFLARRGYSNDPKSDPSRLGRDHSGIISGRSFEKGDFA